MTDPGLMETWGSMRLGGGTNHHCLSCQTGLLSDKLCCDSTVSAEYLCIRMCAFVPWNANALTPQFLTDAGALCLHMALVPEPAVSVLIRFSLIYSEL